MPITKVDDFISYVTKNNNNKFLITGEPELIQEVKLKLKNNFTLICLFTAQIRSFGNYAPGY